MQFVKGGPDIPEQLLQAHEDGQVVFFCGAGISYPAGLPGFQGLVDQLYSDLGVTPNRVQRAAIKANRFDTAISLLEEDVTGGCKTVRRLVSKILTPDLSARNATSTHEALLTLSKNGHERTRLITTNFDRVFEDVIESQKRVVGRYQAPLPPRPQEPLGRTGVPPRATGRQTGSEQPR